jgi:predicted phage tail protein
MARVVLYGSLAEQFGSEFNIAVSSAREAVRMLFNLLPGFKESIREGSYHVFYGDDSEDKNLLELEEDTLHLKSNQQINIMPVAVGAKGLLKTIIGISLFVVGLATGIGPLASFGLNMALSGVAQMLSPKVKAKDTKQSYLIDGPDTTIQTGSPVPLIYGTVLAAGGPISFELDDSPLRGNIKGSGTIFDLLPFQAYEVNP